MYLYSLAITGLSWAICGKSPRSGKGFSVGLISLREKIKCSAKRGEKEGKMEVGGRIFAQNTLYKPWWRCPRDIRWQNRRRGRKACDVSLESRRKHVQIMTGCWLRVRLIIHLVYVIFHHHRCSQIITRRRISIGHAGFKAPFQIGISRFAPDGDPS